MHKQRSEYLIRIDRESFTIHEDWATKMYAALVYLCTYIYLLIMDDRS